MANSDEYPHTAERSERTDKLVLDTGYPEVSASDSQVLPRRRALLQGRPAIIALCAVLLLATIVFLIFVTFIDEAQAELSIAAEIVEDLEAALQQFAAIANDLKK